MKKKRCQGGVPSDIYHRLSEIPTTWSQGLKRHWHRGQFRQAWMTGGDVSDRPGNADGLVGRTCLAYFIGCVNPPMIADPPGLWRMQRLCERSEEA